MDTVFRRGVLVIFGFESVWYDWHSYYTPRVFLVRYNQAKPKSFRYENADPDPIASGIIGAATTISRYLFDQAL